MISTLNTVNQPEINMTGRTGRWMLAIVVLFGLHEITLSQSITWLGGLGDRGSRANGVSADGTVITGVSRNSDGEQRAFRWFEGEMQDLGTLGGDLSTGSSVSADGRVIVGYSTDAGGNERAFRWVDGTMTDIGTIGGQEALAYGVSGDGSVIVGSSTNGDNVGRAFVWINGSMSDPGTLADDYTVAYAVSADGSAVVGESFVLPGRPNAFRWSQNGMVNIGSEEISSVARGVSADGEVVVGRGAGDQGERAFLWTSSTGMVDLGLLPGSPYSEAHAVSSDGKVVAGDSPDEDLVGRAFRWTAQGGMEDLNETYADLLAGGSSLRGATAVSADGRFIVGFGRRGSDRTTQGYILDTHMSTGTDVEPLIGLPSGYILEQNYPNPFNPSTVIRFGIPEAGPVTVEVYNMLGNRVAVLADATLPAGTHDVVFDAPALPSGLYICRMRAGAFTATRKLMLLR
jgi:probable HAF family extracellular repeat protein